MPYLSFAHLSQMIPFFDLTIRILTLVALQVRVILKACRKILRHAYLALDQILRFNTVRQNIERHTEEAFGE